MKTKTIKYTCRLRCTWRILLWLKNTQKTEQQSYGGEQNRHTKYKKLNMTEHKIDIDITKYKKTEHDRAKSTYEHY